MSVKIVRLVSGEEIVCSYTINEEDNTVSMKNPAILVPAGNGQLAFMPWMPYAEHGKDGLIIGSKHVMFVLPPLKDLMNEYNKSIGSGLIMPTASETRQANAQSGPVGSDTNLKLST